MGDIYTILTSYSFGTYFIACKIVIIAMFVLPAPVGAHTNILSEEL